MKGIAKGYEQLHTISQSKTEVHLPCSSCQEIFVRIPVSPTPETQYAEIQAMLKEKEPKCEKCNIIEWMTDENEEPKYTYELDGKKIPLIVSKAIPQGEIWFIQLKSRIGILDSGET